MTRMIKTNRIKPYKISKQIVYEAYKRVKANRGTYGVDRESIEDFEANLKGNLYKIWNRMSSGSYFPSPVLEVAIPKKDGKKRKLGIPTVGDRVAQMVVKLCLEPILEPHFSASSYGYRPSKSALGAVGKARIQCWKYDWIVDIDIRKFFDNLDHSLMMRAVKKHTNCAWIILYIERWLKAPMQRIEGTVESRTKGTPQGGVISPLLANLFLRYAFDKWMKIFHPENPYERYADDIIVHCRTEGEAQKRMEEIGKRLRECHLDLHPTKTKIVYCKDDKRKENYKNEKFVFLGYTFRPRRVKNSGGESFTGFNPGVSNEAKKRMTQSMRRWKLHLRSQATIQEIAKNINPILRGWINYYGKFYKTALRPVLYHLNEILTRWVKRKYKRFRRCFKRAINWLGGIARKTPNLFSHWGSVKPSAE